MASDESFSGNSTSVIYTAWIKSILPSCPLTPDTLGKDLVDGQILNDLIRKTTGFPINDQELESDNSTNAISNILSFLQSKGIDITSLSAEGISEGNMTSVLDLLWLIILHFDVHTQSRAAYQRSVSMGKRFLLEWMARELPDADIDTKGHFVECFKNGALLTNVVSKHCVVDKNILNKEGLNADELHTVLVAADKELGVPFSIISPAALLDCSLDESTLLIYLAVLRRKVCEKIGEESYKGGGTPIKQRGPQTPDRQRTKTPDSQRTKTPDKQWAKTPDKQWAKTPDSQRTKTPDKSTPRSPYSLKSPPTNGDIVSPLSPSTLQNLVEQQAKSHEAIQALQEKLQAVKYQPLTPKFQKKPFGTRRPVKTRSPVKTPLPQSNSPNMKSDVVDCNANLLNTGVEDALNLSTKQIDQLYSAVDRRFLEFMLDAVHKSYLPAEFGSTDSLGNVNEGAISRGEQAVNDSSSSKQESGEASIMSSLETQVRDNEKVTGADFHSTQDGNLSAEGTNSKVGEASEHERHQSSSHDSTITEHENCAKQEEERKVEEEKMKLKTGKHVQFDGQNTIIPSTENTSNHSSGLLTPKASKTEDELTTVVQVDGLPVEKQNQSGSVSHSVASSVTSVPTLEESGTLGQEQPTVDDIRNIPPEFRRGAEVNDNYIHDEESLPDDDVVCFDEENDQFMVYLNSIETTALKFKLQVEQAKIETLQLLKERLERAYEGTPLEDIPQKVHDKLQETIAEIATEEVQKYEDMLKVGDELDEAESSIIEQMRTELDGVAQENIRLHEELDNMKQYEKGYHALKEQVHELQVGMTSLKHNYATKNGESDFLSERIEILEKEILNMRVEYEGHIRDLQNENIELQKECLELDNENRMLEEEVRNLTVGTPRGSDIEMYQRGSDKLCLDDEVAVPALELDALEVRLTELERKNKALRSASSADQAMVQCLESKIDELEKNMKEVQGSNSSLLAELHEAQRQNSSDRAKLSSYREDVETVRRENKVLKGTLEITEGEVIYHKEKVGQKSPRGSRREMWKEIRELETILKDVHREKRTIEKKYLAFKHDSSKSLSFNSTKSDSSPETSPHPVKTTSAVSPGRTRLSEVSPGRSRTSSLLERVNTLLMKSGLPNGVKKESVPEETESKTGSVTADYAMSPRSASLPRTTPRASPEGPSEIRSEAGTPRDKSASLPRNMGSGRAIELNSLRKHVGSLEAEKASILRELERVQSSPKTEIATH